MSHSKNKHICAHSAIQCLMLLYSAIALIAFDTRSTFAIEYEWTGNGSNNLWNNSENWSPTGYPDDSCDTAEIIDGATVVLESRITIGELLVLKGGVLSIRDGGKLTLKAETETTGQLVMQADMSDAAIIQLGRNASLEFNENRGGQKIGGDVRLLTATSEIHIASHATFAPYFDGLNNYYGRVIGEHDDAAVRINTDVVLTSTITIMGKLTIEKGSGKGVFPMFCNCSPGKVLANGGGTLTLGPLVILTDQTGSTWGASGCAFSTLKFCASTTLLGDLILEDCAVIELAPGVEVVTSSTLECGTIIADDASLTAQVCIWLPILGEVCLSVVADDILTTLACALGLCGGDDCE